MVLKVEGFTAKRVSEKKQRENSENAVKGSNDDRNKYGKEREITFTHT